MIDYLLNVAVAGVAALVSAVPTLHAYTLPLCLGVLALLTVANLRGTMDAGRLFALPTYLFIASFAVILLLGGYAAVTRAVIRKRWSRCRSRRLRPEAVGLWLLLRAFASGCTAMTGVEAVSNGMSVFREGNHCRHARHPARRHRLRRQAPMASWRWTNRSPTIRVLLSQLAGAVVGGGAFYYVAFASALAILCLSADTSFVGFAQLCRMVAQDGFLPRPFAIVGRRLVFSVGILYLALTAGLLLVAFGDITDRLIPLFAIGAFLTFTMSQAGMVAH